MLPQLQWDFYLGLFLFSFFCGGLYGSAYAESNPTLGDLKNVQVELTAKKRDLVATVRNLEEQQILITEEISRVKRAQNEVMNSLKRGSPSIIQQRNLLIRSESYAEKRAALELKMNVLQVEWAESSDELVRVERDLEMYSSQIGDGTVSFEGRFEKVKVNGSSQYDNPEIEQ